MTLADYSTVEVFADADDNPLLFFLIRLPANKIASLIAELRINGLYLANAQHYT